MFTEDLIHRTIQHFSEKYDHHISEETAERYLNSLADLYGSFRQLLSEQQGLKNTETRATLDQ